jgi:hypothetical protein
MKTFIRVLAGVIALGSASYVRADDITLRYDPVTLDSNQAPLPVGVMLYRILQKTGVDGEFRQVGETPDVRWTRRGVDAGFQCFVMVPVFTPATPVEGETWMPGPDSPESCVTVQAAGGPRERRPAGVANIRIEQRPSQ